MDDKKIDYFLEKNRKTKVGFLSYIGMLVTIVGMIVVFVISTTQANGGSAKIKSTLSSYQFWVMFTMVLAISITVSFTNYSSAKEKEKEGEFFKKVLLTYGEVKQTVDNNLQYLGAFCADKNKQMYVAIQRNICLEAGIEYEDYKNNRINYDTLEKWQKKRLKALSRIHISFLTTKDLLVETKFGAVNKAKFLPTSESTNDKKFVSKIIIKKTINTLLGCLTVALSIYWGGWIAGVVSAFNILVGAIMSTIKGHVFVKTTLADRFIVKTDLLKEYYSVRDKYVVAKEMTKTLQKNAQEPLQEEIRSNLIEVSQERKEEPQGQNMKLQNDNELDKIEKVDLQQKVDKVMNDVTIDIVNSKEK